MRNECNIVRDLLPLYAENMVSPDTADFIDEHLKSCDACQKEYEQIKTPQTMQKTTEAAPLLKLSQKMKAKKIQTIALTVVFVMALFISAFAVLDAPTYIPYSEELITLEQHGDDSILLTFDEAVTDFNYTIYADPNGEAFYYCDIEAWTSLWDQWFSKSKGKLSASVAVTDTKPIILAYVPNDENENICIGKYDPNAQNPIETDIDYESTTVLPRLSLGLYVILAISALVFMVVVWFLTRKKAELHIWAERIGLYPVSYIISHCIVSGISTTSYSLQRDFCLMIFISLLLYSGLLLTHNILNLKKEIQKINN